MIKGIKITQEIKDKNPDDRLISNSAVNTIIRMTVPTVFNGADNCYGGYDIREDLQVLDGFKDIESPSYNTSTHKLGTELIDNSGKTKFTYAVIAKSSEEITNEVKQALDSDEAANKVSARISDGETYYKRKMDVIERAFYDNLLSAQAILFANNYFDNSLAPLTRGNWASAQTNLLSVPTLPTSFTFQEKNLLSSFYQDIKADVDTYVSQTYQNN